MVASVPVPSTLPTAVTVWPTLVASLSGRPVVATVTLIVPAPATTSSLVSTWPPEVRTMPVPAGSAFS